MLQHIKNMNSLKDLIKFHRAAANLSRRELAEFSGVSTTFLSDVEGGKETVQYDKLLAVFKTLNITIIFDSPILSDIRNEKG